MLCYQPLSSTFILNACDTVMKVKNDFKLLKIQYCPLNRHGK